MSCAGRGVRGCGLLLAVTAVVALAGCPAVNDGTAVDLSGLQTFVADFLRQVFAAWVT
jgi:hypothetical protein